MQWLIDIVYEKVMAAIGGPPFYVDRGDPIFWDFSTPDFIFDGNWHTLDLSGIVPAGASAVHFRCVVYATTIGPIVSFRRVGNSRDFNIEYIRSTVASVVYERSGIVALDTTRTIEYLFTSGPIVFMAFVVRGWWI